MYRKIIQQAIKGKAAKKVTQAGGKTSTAKTIKKASDKSIKWQEKANKAVKEYKSDLQETWQNPVATVRDEYFEKIDKKLKKYSQFTGNDMEKDFQKWQHQFWGAEKKEKIGKAILKDKNKADTFFAGTKEIWQNSEYEDRLETIKEFYSNKYYELKEQGADVELIRIMNKMDVENLTTMDLIDITEELSGTEIEFSEDDEWYRQNRSKIGLAIREVKASKKGK